VSQCGLIHNVQGQLFVERLHVILKQYWGYDEFLPLQREAMACAMEARDSVVVLPTGGGKSLCFQVPAVALDGMAVVVSPLLSLMKDQVDALHANGVPAAKIDGTMTEAERQSTHNAIRQRTLKLLYVSPERLAQPRFLAYLQDAGVSCFVIDEAHCISQWGHDFRTEYRELRRLRELFPDKAIHAFTATATPHVRDDIIRELALRDPHVLEGCYDRPNLTYRVLRRSNGYGQIREVVDAHANEAGIIYCIRRADVETLHTKLTRDGYKALRYHAGLDDATRKRNQDAFSRDEVDIVVATVAFGMGIDKSNVRYVIHAAMPKSIEHYHQETGRAGRDRLPADCHLFYSFADFKMWESIVDKGEPEASAIARNKLRDMLRYCEQHVCRHKALVSYFGQGYAKTSCDACDVCLSEMDAMDGAGPVVEAILDCVSALGDIAGPSYTSLVLKGSREERVLAKGHERLSCHGALSDHAQDAIRDWIEQLVQQEYLEKTGEYNILRLTAKGRAAQRGEASPHLSRAQEKRAKKALTKAGPLSADGKALFEALRQLRREKAQELNVPPYVVFSDATLRDMARIKPSDTRAFLTVKGVGQRKCEAFGDEFLRAIRAFSEALDAGNDIPLDPPSLVS
jgi:ATP-dependent DNA helicase RecQ